MARRLWTRSSNYLGTRPGADVLQTSCRDGTGSPRGFYLRYGFTDTGRVMRGENVLALDLTPGDTRDPRGIGTPEAR